ncbi:hypothetical protein FISHEDRAFT_57746 [Fistulina hepatica ATCC 64428]|uniref:Uncharacterized protein n=1 Tax=Fistulina hepatica ATCC 64428 TaxID=1128425 RepID=A0A0D7AF51_9AGAR|nr:hypothetical protein FISHEDRAFT_57746 [Fistulina hepatica ATCC 64428]
MEASSLPLGLIPTAVIAVFTLTVASIIWAKTTIYFALLPILAAATICLQQPDSSSKLWLLWLYPFSVPICINLFGSDVLQRYPAFLLSISLVGAVSFVAWVLTFTSPIQGPEIVMSMATVSLPRSNALATGWGSLGAFVDWFLSPYQLCVGRRPSSSEETPPNKYIPQDITDIGGTTTLRICTDTP